MIKIRHILLLLVLTTALTLFSNGNSEERETKRQYSSDIIIKDGDNNINSFKVIRDSKLGSELIKIVSNSDSFFIMEEFTVDSYQEITPNNLTYNGNKTNTKLKYFKDYNYTKTKDLDNLPDTISLKYSDKSIILGIILINKDTPSNSFKLILEVLPNIAINPDDFTSTSQLIDTLEQNSDYKRFFKNQLLGSNTFTSSSGNPFPISEIDNQYVYKLKLNSDLAITKENAKNNIGYFDTIYNYNVNSSKELGHSVIQKFLKVYFDKSKPIFHHYINEYMEGKNKPFDYNQYTTITKSDGEELVSCALKYLTWGLEYTLDKNQRDNNSSNNIYPSQLLEQNNNLDLWLKSYEGISLDNRENNYLPFKPKSINSPVNELDPTFNSEKVAYLEEIAAEYFQAPNSKLDNIELTTPFYLGDSIITGSSLPYVEGGMDSPRTFNYKMKKQFDVVKRYKTIYPRGSLYGNNNYFTFDTYGNKKTAKQYYFALNDSVGNNFMVNVNTDKPFVPGKNQGNTYRGINLTGVDSLGLLSGSIAMTSFYTKILGIENDKKSKTLDDYYKMGKTEDGKVSSDLLDSEGEPQFTLLGEYDLDKIRFTREDIERSSVIIPDLSLIQPGDLLVNTTNGRTEVGIVVDSGYKDGDTTFNIGNVLVLSVTKQDGRVSLNYWGNSGILSSFTDSPKDFIPRRLIKYIGKEPKNFEGDDLWDPFVYTPETILADIDLGLNKQTNRNYSHWIPNTGELYEIRSISFKNKDNKLIEGNNIPVKLLPPTDQYYSNSDPENSDTGNGSNINVNKGDGFEFYAVQITSNNNEIVYDNVKLATFKKLNISQGSRSRYEVIYEPGIFTTDGDTKEDFSLQSVYGKLEFKKDDNNIYSRFGIRPLENNIRPGDDILLNFQLNINDNPIDALSKEEDFLAVYDKKMLWRANLYIDDDKTGLNDFNNKYPWNAPPNKVEADVIGDYIEVQLNNNYEEISNPRFKIIRRFYSINQGSYPNNTTSLKVWYGPNEWNRVMVTKDQAQQYSVNNTARGYNWEDLSQLIQGNGKQVVSIPSSVYYNRGINKSSRINTNSVVYEFCRTTTPFEFYNQMQEQYEYMLDKSTELENIMNEAKELLDSEDTDENRNAFDEVKEAYKYIKPNPKTLLPSLYTTLGYLQIEDGNKQKLLEIWKKYDPSKAKPASRDALGWTVSPQKPFLQPEGEQTMYGINYSKKEAGVDCGGLIYMSEAYIGTKYKSYGEGSNSAERGIRSIHDTGQGTVYTPNDNLYNIMESSEFSGLKRAENRKRVVPGDIIYYSTSKSYHVMIVQNVDIIDGNREVELDKIKVIESTHDGDLEGISLYGVGNKNNLSVYNNRNMNWILGRIKQND
ncbi:hypothetical protein EW093_11545 [Thiospirochaeta perfilievii]|uniref:Uncharacterized protein n=1 Tax=Thiospirochaeta perfilievii TaxID=252967 RepID=A0A5C1QEA8_9SPIO|nr:hypothetical protein [Thiospirochaeta perfilievii]QEN05319.1 hypothetical protein EW093_11545 [Thiospirochaeta perfilievii]